MKRLLIIFSICLLGNNKYCSAQVVIADSLQIYQYYHGLLDNPHRVRDTVDGKIREKYIQLETPYDHISKVDKIQKINDQFVVGTWKLDTINPIWEVYELKFKKNHDFFKYDSVTIL
jgi:hypothetical protein